MPAGARSTAKPLVRPSIDATTPDVAASPGVGFVSKVPDLRVKIMEMLTTNLITGCKRKGSSRIEFGSLGENERAPESDIECTCAKSAVVIYT